MRWIEAVYFVIALVLFVTTVSRRSETHEIPSWQNLPLWLIGAALACVFWPFTMLACALEEEI